MALANPVPGQIDRLYLNKIAPLALLHPEQVVLSARNTSGKTYTLFVILPGIIQKRIVRLHRREHKKFWAIVKAAQEWLDGAKAIYMLAQVMKIVPRQVMPPVPAEVVRMTSVPSSLLLAQAASNVGKTQKHHYQSGKAAATTLANSYHHDDPIGPSLRAVAREAGLL